MSEGSLIMGTGRGKLGNMVLYRAGGQERQRAYISRIANPQSTGQIINRSRFRISGVSYKSLAAASERISLASRATTAYNAFISRNVKKAPYHYKNFTEFCGQNGFALPAPWQVANGPLVTPSFLQGGVTWSADSSSSGNTGSITASLSLAETLQVAQQLGIAAGSVIPYSALVAMLWRALGLSTEIHLCSCVGVGITTTYSSEVTNRVAMVSSIHNLCEIWPDCPDFYDSQFVLNSSGDGMIDAPGSGATVTGGFPLFGQVIGSGSTATASISINVTNTPDGGNVFTLYFSDIAPTPALGVQTGNFGAVWIANGSTDATSTASLTLSSSLTTAYNTLLGEAWRDLVLPSWRVSSSTTNEGVYNG